MVRALRSRSGENTPQLSSEGDEGRNELYGSRDTYFGWLLWPTNRTNINKKGNGWFVCLFCWLVGFVGVLLESYYHEFIIGLVLNKSLTNKDFQTDINRNNLFLLMLRPWTRLHLIKELDSVYWMCKCSCPDGWWWCLPSELVVGFIWPCQSFLLQKRKLAQASMAHLSPSLPTVSSQVASPFPKTWALQVASSPFHMSETLFVCCHA